MTKFEIREKALKNHIQRIENRLKKLETKQVRFSKYRPAIFIIGIGLVYWFDWISFVLAILLLIVESIYHKYFGRAIKRHQIWLEIKKTQIARMNLDWENIPEPFNESLDTNHPFEVDLNITGKRSLHQLINLAISIEGTSRLKSWLLQTFHDVKQIETRKKIIRELVPLARFRDKLLLNFYLVSREQLDGKKLLGWLRSKNNLDFLPKVLILSFGLAVLNIALFVSNSLGLMAPFWIFSIFLYAGLYFFYSPRFSNEFENVNVLDDELRKFRAILGYIEKYSFGSNIQLKQLCKPFLNKRLRPSVQLRKVKLLTIACGLRMNPAMAFILNIAFPWDLLCAYLIKRARNQFSELFPLWLDTLAELEALISLANFSYLNPDYIFPEIISGAEKNQTIFEVEKIGHPLIPADQKVCNDFFIKEFGEIALLTGSNMAGKSTFLKTIGINLCLAFAGGPVNAVNFRTIPFRIFCSMQITDSIIDGISYFYAEVKRLKILLDSLEERDKKPVFWFIDEIYKGTNSRERLIGSRAYLKYLSKQSGVGLLATHDLELAGMSDQITKLSNYHFRDDVKNGKMMFEYKLHPGPCPSTNALKIMRLDGLPIK